MITLKQSLAIISVCFISKCAIAQTTEGVSIKTNVSPPHPSAMLDVESASKGILIPRVPLQDVTLAAPVSTPTNGLLVYNTTIGAIGLPDGEGFYFWDGTKWQKLASVGGTSGYWSPSATGNHIYHGSIPTQSTDGATMVGIEKMPTGCQSEFYVNGASTFFASDPGVVATSVSPTSGIQIGAPWTSTDGGHWNEINVPEFYLDIQFNTGHDVNIGSGGKGSNLTIYAGTDKPGNIHASGNVYAAGVLLTSDSTSKKNIVACNNVLTKINNCNTYMYNFKAEPNNNKKHVGVLAQELEGQFPELVTDRVDVLPKNSKFSTTEIPVTKTTKNVDYAGLTAVLLQAIKEQQAQIEELKARVTALENR